MESIGSERLRALAQQMIEFDQGDPKRIQHFIKVHSFAALIGRAEGLDAAALFTLEAAALVHDIGIHPAEEKFGRCDGKLQEQEGPAPARAMLAGLGFAPEVIERVCWLVAHHHTCTGVDGLDHRILLEADALVNLYEDGCGPQTVRTVLERVFRTPSGTRLCRTMFGVTEAAS